MLDPATTFPPPPSPPPHTLQYVSPFSAHAKFSKSKCILYSIEGDLNGVHMVRLNGVHMVRLNGVHMVRLNGFYSGMTRWFVCWHGSMVCILAWLNGLYGGKVQ